MSEPIGQEKKKGTLRLFELLDRDSGKFFKAGVLAILGMIPYIACLVAAVGGGVTIALLGCIPAGMLAAPQICGVADTIMRSMRDEIGWWWWDTYKTAWKRNAKASLLPGAIFGFLSGVMVFSLYLLAGVDNPYREFWMLAAAMVIGFGIASFYAPMLVCMEIPFPALLRNCFVLFFNHPIKSVFSAILQIIYYLVILVWFPLTSVIFVLASVWFPMLLSVMILYPALDKHFGLKKAYEEIQKRQWEGEGDLISE